MKIAVPFLFALLFAADLPGQATEQTLKDSMEFGHALLRLLKLPSTHVTFDTDGSLTGIACPGGFSDAAAETLHLFPRLRSLRIQGDKLSGRGYKEIGRIKNLEELSIVDGHVNDADLKNLTAQAKLVFLEISNSPEPGSSRLNDKAVSYIIQCRNLKNLILLNSNLSKVGFEKLEMAIPGLKVSY
jgi:hypothetical protein